MKKNLKNSVTIDGYIYQHELEKKVTGPKSKSPNTEYITGTLEVATDEECINIVPVHFSYVTAKTGKGKDNATFAVLSKIIAGEYKTVMEVGKAAATKVQIDSAIGLNEFYSDRNGKEEFISVKRNEGGFVHVVSAFEKEENKRNRFECDMLITGARRVEANEDRGTAEHVIIKGAVFDFRTALLPVEFTVYDEKAMNYFEGVEPSSKAPFFTRVAGNEISQVLVRRVEEESAFGAPSVKEYKTTKKEFVVTWATNQPYEFGEEDSMTVAELTDLMAQREMHLAEVKQRREEYKASKNQPAAAPAKGEFNF